MFLPIVLFLYMVCVFYHIFQSLQLVIIDVDYCGAESLVVLSEFNRKTNSKVVVFPLRNKSTMKNNGSACMKCIICRSELNIGYLVKVKSR